MSFSQITGSVVGIDSKNWLSITEKSFKGMSNLQFLRVKNDLYHPNIISSPGPLTFISPKLRLLDWSCFPMTSLRFINNLEFLVELRMCYSKLEKLWDGIQVSHLNIFRVSIAKCIVYSLLAWKCIYFIRLLLVLCVQLLSVST